MFSLQAAAFNKAAEQVTSHGRSLLRELDASTTKLYYQFNCPSVPTLGSLAAGGILEGMATGVAVVKAAAANAGEAGEAAAVKAAAAKVVETGAVAVKAAAAKVVETREAAAVKVVETGVVAVKAAAAKVVETGVVAMKAAAAKVVETGEAAEAKAVEAGAAAVKAAAAKAVEIGAAAAVKAVETGAAAVVKGVETRRMFHTSCGTSSKEQQTQESPSKENQCGRPQVGMPVRANGNASWVKFGADCDVYPRSASGLSNPPHSRELHRGTPQVSRGPEHWLK
ncbi:hypothetical protein VOLCADRAFT_106087 [Volvox carteri f. nagariensis]|uniref:Uncharacterized protein n=1 Tax=Volvox carteri f. nagariensis TaxID=3068 RepID=D8U4Z7_VOLCA|nr:uncharacterized protein VOLCADRAFT_106087 [Volvox carteri f. nagariensis]EFJ45280.1 hypothetical protein VOLCADRAFT_106087 [Volvox carteri f. nagariensis]|eukprot:XP_002953656.1 hypothetical protein VOLCADRAFT_106087 [Volvox carteri f. nagariensis]